MANLARSAQPVELDLKHYKGLVPVEMLGQTPFPPISELPYLLTLPRQGFYWFRLTRTAPPVWHEGTLPGLELRVLVLFQGWKSFFVDQVEPGRRAMAAALHERLVRQVLPEFLPTQRWFAGKGGRIEKVEFEKYDIWPDRNEWLLARIRVWLVGRSEPQDYGLPLALAWEEDGDEKLRPLWPYALAKVRVRARMGLLYGAFADERFCQNLVGMIARGAQIPLGQGWLRFSTTRVFAELAGDAPESLPARRLALDSSNTTIAIGDRLMMKGYRRLRPGINPELEMGRFLTEIAFPNIAPLAGALEYEDEAGDRITLVLLQGFVANQGDAWSYTQDYLKRFLTDCLEQPDEVRKAGENAHSIYLLFAATLGRRTGELHRALAQTTGDPAFDPEPIAVVDMAEWLDRIRKEAKTTFERLEQARRRLPEPARSLAEQVLAAGIGLPRAGRLRLAGCPSAGVAGRGGGAARPDRGAHPAGHEDPLSWGLSPRPSVGGQGRRDHHRLRGRAVAVAGGATRQTLAATGCGRHVALVQLCRACRPAPGHRRWNLRPGGALAAAWRLGTAKPSRVSERLRRSRGRQSGIPHRSRSGEGAAGTVYPGEGVLRTALRTG